MRRNSKTLPGSASNVIDNTFTARLRRRHEDRQARLILEANKREHVLLSLFQQLPLDKQVDIVAIVEAYHQTHGLDQT